MDAKPTHTIYSMINSRRHFISRLLGAGGSAMILPVTWAEEASANRQDANFNVRAWGAAGDGLHLDTLAIQKAIDACASQGGGTVFFPPGTFLTGTLVLKSKVTLRWSAGATLLGSPNLRDYPAHIPALRSYTDNYTEKSLIYGENLQQVGLEGPGIIDGQGASFKGPYKVRPYLMRLVSCQDVRIKDLTLLNSPMWVQHYLACDRVWIEGIRVHSHCNSNNDGIDIDGCYNVRIANCDISSGDDAIVLKSTLNRPCKHVVVTNCLLSSDCNAFKLGTESNGGFEDIVLGNCAIYDTRLSGIALELVDGGKLDGVNISNVVMRNVRSGIFVRLGNRARPFQEGQARPGQGSLQNISISQVQADGLDRIGCSITGLPGHPVANITLDQIRLKFAGGQPAAQKPVPEQADKYPEYPMFGVLPAYGFYCRHARNLRFSQVQVAVMKPDERPSLMGDDVEDWDIFRWDAAAPAKDQPVIHFKDVRRAMIHGCRCPQDAPAFLRLEGQAANHITLLDNDLSAAKKIVEFGAEVSKERVVIKP